MADWTSGYYLELNPLRVKLAFLNSGLACPEFGTACELGNPGSPGSWIAALRSQ